MSSAPSFQVEAERQAARLPDLLVAADHLASTVLLGTHGRRRAGQGDDFWQYRPLVAGDSLRDVDWRRSARGDQSYVRQKEWQLAQSVALWVDPAATMRFASSKDLPTKAERAKVLGLAACILMLRAGERVGLAHRDLPPRRSPQQRMALALGLEGQTEEEYDMPNVDILANHSRVLFLSDFLAPMDEITTAVGRAADKGISGVLMQVLDPAEEDFPFRGRTIFESVGGTLSHETQRAADLRARYLDRLAERRDALTDLARSTGWIYGQHRSDHPAQAALLWIYQAMEGTRR